MSVIAEILCNDARIPVISRVHCRGIYFNLKIVLPSHTWDFTRHD